ARDWAEVQEPFLAPVFEKVLEKAGVGPGIRVLDIGCGAGGFLRMAAAAGAVVTGLDASEGLLRIARERIPRGEFSLGDMQHLPFEEASFDVVTAFNSIQHAPDPEKALAEARRVVRPGGVVAGVVWADEHGDVARVMDEVRDILTSGREDEESRQSEETPFAGGESDALVNLLQAAGLLPETPVELEIRMEYPDRATMLRGFMSPGPVVQAIEKFGETKVSESLVEAMKQYAQAGGGYRLVNRFALVSSRR
ncbi:MAG: class I SAM-dependent methyltransferase, partial [Actinomycetota bacterium]